MDKTNNMYVTSCFLAGGKEDLPFSSFLFNIFPSTIFVCMMCFDTSGLSPVIQ